MFCTACAAPNPIAAPRCARCGSRLGRDGAAAVGRGGRRRWALLLVAVPPLAALAVGAGYRQATRADLADAYARAGAAAAAGRFEEALDAYAAAGDYGDAAARRAALDARLQPQRSAYLAGVAALDAGRYDQAVAALLPVVRDLPDRKSVV